MELKVGTLHSILNESTISYQGQHETHLNFKLYCGDLTDSTNITRIIHELQPDEIYNLGAMSHIKTVF
jgi:GDPmannose 4,6-dehydratase